MAGESQLCSIAKAAEVFCGRWTALILHALGNGATRFSELNHALPLTSRSLLARRLKELEAEGVIARRKDRARRGWSYQLTPAGRALLPLVEGLSDWGERWTRRQLKDDELDIGLLLWEIESSAEPDTFGETRHTVLLEFSDQPRNKRYWWFINEGGKTKLCLEDPGFEVDLHLVTTLPAMAEIWRGTLSFRRALSSGKLDAAGPRHLQRALPAWLGLERDIAANNSAAHKGAAAG